MSLANQKRDSVTAKRVLISLNPKAGADSSERKISQLVAKLTDYGFEVEVFTDIDRIVAETRSSLQSQQLRAVVAAGGDGTVSLLADRTPQGTPIAVLPLGTENLLAKHFRITSDVELFAELIRSGKVITTDAGRVNGKIFHSMCTAGFDADVVTRLHKERTGHIRHLSYAKPILRSILEYRYPELRVYCGNEKRPVKARWFFAFNFPCYAMGLPIVDDADGYDGQIDVCTFRGSSLGVGLIYLLGVIFRRHRGWRDIHYEKTTRIRVESDEEVPFQVDGDPGGTLPLEIEAMPHRLSLLVPYDWKQRK